MFDENGQRLYPANINIPSSNNHPGSMVLNHELDLFYVEMLELLHTHLGFIFPKVILCLLVIISHYPISYILGENIPPGEYSLSVDTSV